MRQNGPSVIKMQHNRWWLGHPGAWVYNSKWGLTTLPRFLAGLVDGEERENDRKQKEEGGRDEKGTAGKEGRVEGRKGERSVIKRAFCLLASSTLTKLRTCATKQDVI